MPQLSERRRKARRRAAHVTGPTWVMLENVPGARADVRAKVVDFSDDGIRIELSLALKPKQSVVVKARAENVVPNGQDEARVVDCRPLSTGGYSVGLAFESGANEKGNAAEKSKRRQIMEMLYAARRRHVNQAAVSVHQIEGFLGCSRERLEFTLWYLEDHELIACADDRYSITAKGVDFVEAEEVDGSPSDRRIAACD